MLSSILKQCISLNAEAQARCPFKPSGMSPELYRREFKSIFLDMGRNVGKSRTIIDFYRAGDLVIAQDISAAAWFPTYINVVPQSAFFDDISRRGKHHVDTSENYIFVDEPAQMTARNLETLYYTTDAALYIFLGKVKLGVYQ